MNNTHELPRLGQRPLAWQPQLDGRGRLGLPGPSAADYFPREVFFFFGVTALPLAAACFCFFFAVMLDM